MSKHRELLRCAESGCHEVETIQFDSYRDRSEYFKRHSEWRCMRHNGRGNIQRTDTYRRIELTCVKRDSGKYFERDGKLTSGFIHGEGWNAFADDFEVGDKIIFDVKIVACGMSHERDGAVVVTVEGRDHE